VGLFDDLDGGEEEHESDERWIVSYADFITTLFALFVLLFALSLKDARLRAGIESVARMMGARPLIGGVRPDTGQGPVGVAPPRPATIPAVPSAGSQLGVQGPDLTMKTAAALPDFAQLKRIKENLERDLSAFTDSGVSLKLTPEGLVISLAAARFFKSGQAEIEPTQEPILGAVARNIGNLRNRMRIEGFTDPIPIHNSRFIDNWDLSAERAGNVLRYLLDHSNLDPNRLSLAGYGPYRPIADNETEEGRALNRRVDIVIRPNGGSEQ
jgi:chemotaxis protein MotB